MNIWQHEFEHEAEQNDELGTGELIGHLAKAIEAEGYDNVYDEIMNRQDDAFSSDHPQDDVRPSRRAKPSPNLYIKGIDPLGPRYTENGGEIVIIPGDNPMACTPLVLTLINSRRSRWPAHGWPHHDDRTRESVRQAEWRRWVMMRMKIHLIACEHVLQKMVVVVDHWDPQVFELEHALELGAWRERGVRFVFLLVTRRNGISPLQVRL